MSHDQSDHFAATQSAAPLVSLEEVPHHVREVARQDTLFGEKLMGLRNCGRKTIEEILD